MTLRSDEKGKPVGLDWSVCNDGTSSPEVWKQAARRIPAEPRDEDAERPGPKRLAPAIEARVIRMYRDRLMSALEIGRELGIQSATVFKVLKRNNVPTRSRSEGMRLSRAKRSTAA